MANKSIIIIGAGIAGLATGCYAQMNSYQTQIFELHTLPGGLCTSWKRKGYVFDGCIHWLVGSNPKSDSNRIWQELGAVQGRSFVEHETFVQVVGTGGKTFRVYTNIDRLEQHMKELSPADSQVIEEFTRATRSLTRMDMPLDMPAGLLNKLKAGLQMLPHLGAMRKWSKIPIETYAQRFSDPFLRQAFGQIFDGVPDFPMLGFMMTLAWMHKRDAGYPLGGSLAFAQAIEKRYLDLGGQIHYNARVAEILVETSPEQGRRNNCAVGVRLADGSEHRADVVISAADGHATIFDMLKGNYIDDTVRGYYDELPIFRPIIQVSLGLKRDMSGAPSSVVYQIEQPITIAGEERALIGFRHLCHDPTLAPAGKSVVLTVFPSEYAYWKELAQDRERYEAEKQHIALAVMDQLERRYPGVTADVEAVDVTTPLTYERHTGNWQGSMEGWLLTTKTIGMMFGKGMSKTLPGLENFYMVGQWVEPGGGIPTAAMSGRGLVKRLCQQDKKPFVAAVA